MLCIRLENGKVREARVSHNPSGPENPLNDEELKVKFRTNPKRTLRMTGWKSCEPRWKRSTSWTASTMSCGPYEPSM